MQIGMNAANIIWCGMIDQKSLIPDSHHCKHLSTNNKLRYSSTLPITLYS